MILYTACCCCKCVTLFIIIEVEYHRYCGSLHKATWYFYFHPEISLKESKETENVASTIKCNIYSFYNIVKSKTNQPFAELASLQWHTNVIPYSNCPLEITVLICVNRRQR